MTDQNTCATCDYFRVNAPGHGTCHIDPPGNSVRNGFPIVAATDWCAKGATSAERWSDSKSATLKDREIECLIEKCIAADQSVVDVSD